MENWNKSKSKVQSQRFPILIFISAFACMGILTTIQMNILGEYIDYTQIAYSKFALIIIFWLLIATIFTIWTRYQINSRYDKPMREFAEATKKVADGDFSVYVKPLHTSDKLDYLDVMFSDFNTMVEALGSIETLKTDFFSNVSHEIKTPLAVLQNYAEGLKKGGLTKEQEKEYLDAIIGASKRMSGLITNILKLNKLERQIIRPSVEEYDLCAQLCECALSFEQLWESKQIELEFDIEDKATIEADSNLLELVWNNLLSNAIKFTGVGGTVKLKQVSTKDEVVVTVIDSGCGMDEKTLNHIFDKFYQGDTSHSTEGYGLGLALVLRVLQISDGSISVRSVLGQGATFEVRIPTTRERFEDS